MGSSEPIRLLPVAVKLDLTSWYRFHVEVKVFGEHCLTAA